MAVVNEVETRFRVSGAKEAQRADRNVRDSITETSKTAQRESGTINRWMERHQAAIQAIGMATAGVLAGIISASPTMRAELAGVRMAFSLFADTVINDVLPGGRGLVDVAFQIQSAYSNIPQPLRESASALLLFGGAAGLAFVALGPLAAGAVGIAGALYLLNQRLGPTAMLIGAVAIASGVLLFTVGPLAALIMAIAGGFVVLSTVIGRANTLILASAVAAGVLASVLGVLSAPVLALIGLVALLALAWQNNWLGIRDIVGNSVDWIGDRIAWLNDFIHADTDEKIEMIKDLYLGFKDWLGDIGSAAGQMFRDAFNAAIPSSVAIPSITVAGKTFGGQSISLPRLRYGGEIESGGLARLHAGERVIPAADVQPLSDSGGGGGNTVIFESGAIQVNGAGSPRRTAEKTADEVSNKIQDDYGMSR